MGGFQYSLKMFVFEKVRSKRFPWAWSLLQAIQAPFLGLGVVMNAVIDGSFGSKRSIYVCITLVVISCVVMFFIDVCKRKRGRSRRQKVEHKAVIKKDEGVVMENEEDEAWLWLHNVYCFIAKSLLRPLIICNVQCSYC